jgi:hypothetical protein
MTGLEFSSSEGKVNFLLMLVQEAIIELNWKNSFTENYIESPIEHTGMVSDLHSAQAEIEASVLMAS